MRVLLALLLIAAPVCAAEERELWCEQFEAEGAEMEICARRTTRNVPSVVERPLIREPSFVILSPLSGRQTTMPPVTTRTRRVRLGRNGRVTVGY